MHLFAPKVRVANKNDCVAFLGQTGESDRFKLVHNSMFHLRRDRFAGSKTQYTARVFPLVRCRVDESLGNRGVAAQDNGRGISSNTHSILISEQVIQWLL